jgi:DNA-binding HxlR family transcriptional regulator
MTIKRKFDKLPPYCQFEKNINLLKNKWTIYIIRDIILGKKYFSEFKEDKPELSNKVLTQRLKELENNKIIKKVVDDNETSYYLTERGERLRNIIYELAIFNIEESGYGEEEIEKIKKELCQLKEEEED